MTAESKQVVAMIEKYPAEVREHVRDAVCRLLEVYRSIGAPENAQRELNLHWRRDGSENVIDVLAFQGRPRAVRRAKASGRKPCPPSTSQVP